MSEAASRRAKRAQCQVLIRLGPQWAYHCISEEGHDPELWHKFHIDDEGVASLGDTAIARAVAEERKKWERATAPLVCITNHWAAHPLGCTCSCEVCRAREALRAAAPAKEENDAR